MMMIPTMKMKVAKYQLANEKKLVNESPESNSPALKKQRLNELSNIFQDYGKDKVFAYIQDVLDEGSDDKKNALISFFDDIDK